MEKVGPFIGTTFNASTTVFLHATCGFTTPHIKNTCTRAMQSISPDTFFSKCALFLSSVTLLLCNMPVPVKKTSLTKGKTLYARLTPAMRNRIIGMRLAGASRDTGMGRTQAA